MYPGYLHGIGNNEMCIRDSVKVSDLAEAYELCQKRSSLVVGGMVWMNMPHITKRTLVDLSGLGLDLSLIHI